jgi:hypothetical protein
MAHQANCFALLWESAESITRKAYKLLLEHDVFQKPVPTFRHHALGVEFRGNFRRREIVAAQILEQPKCPTGVDRRARHVQSVLK